MKRLILISSLFLALFAFAAMLPGWRQTVFSLRATAQTTDTVSRGAQTRRERKPLDNFDIRADRERALTAPPATRTTPSGRAVAEAETAAQEFLAAHPRTVMRWSSLTGTPSRLSNLSAPLSPPSRAAAETIGRRFMKDNRALFRLPDSEVDALQLARHDRTAHNGVTHVSYEQQVNGIEVFQSRFSVHVDRNGAVIAADGELLPAAASRINRTAARLSSAEALLLAAEAAETAVTAMNAPETESRGAARAIAFGAVPNVATKAAARLVYFPLAADSLRLAWEFTLWMQDTPDVYLLVIDAERGSLLHRHNYTQYENPHGLVYTGESPRPNLPQTTTAPPIVDRQDLPFNGAPYFPTTDKHYDWWNGQSQTTLVSNNVDAHLDRSGAADVADEPRLTVPDSNFSFPIDFSLAPTTDSNQKAAQVNLFYWINRYHDILYSYGFTESAGNFQSDNFGLGGQGNDAIQADAQDGSGTSNANFSTPPDGGAGRVQMYLWSTANPQLDGDLDQGVIIHELTHGLSNRLVGNAGGLNSLQAAGMGEGWSDYFGLVLLAKAGDNLEGKYPVGQYATNNYNVGIRRYPYSTDKTVNPLTFANVSLSTSVHRTGEIWCLNLWEMRAALIKKYGFTEGQRQSLQLVVDGMKLTPSGEPTFLEARDAILLADRVNNAGINQCLLWEAFAKRGLGYSASTFSSADTAPKEAFDLPPSCNDAGTLTLDRSNYLIGELVQVKIADRNAATPVQVTLSTAAGDAETLTLTPEANFPGSYKGQLRVVTGIVRHNDGALQVSTQAGDQITARYNDQNTGAGAVAQVTSTASTAYEKHVFLDNVEQGNQGWLRTGNWAIVNSRAASPARSWTDSPTGNYPNNSNFTLTSSLFDCSNLTEVTLQFAHSYDTESGFDYAIVEFSTDDGATWQGAAAYSGRQTAFNQAVVKINGLNNQPRGRVRFRLQADPMETGDGWYLDDLRLTGRSANRAVVNPGEQRAPQVLALSPAFGPPAGGTRVSLTGTNFTETADTTVTFDGVPVTGLTVISNSLMTMTAPPHAAGAVVVRVKNKYGESSLSNGFTYYQSGGTVAAPVLGQVFPASGSTRGGLSVTLTGANFTPETTVKFGAQAALVTFVNATTLRVLSPVAGGAGAVDVSATNGANTVSLANAFTYVAPTPPTVQVLTPTPGQTVYLNSALTISWNSSDNQALTKHRVSLLRDAAVVAELATDLPGNTQSLNWLVPTSQPVADNYRIRVVATDDEGAETEALSGTFSLTFLWQMQAAMPSSLLRVITASDGQYLYAIGGRSAGTSSTATNLVRRFDPTSNTWTSLATLPVLLSSGEAVHLNGKIYVLGGQTEAVPLGMVYIYDIATNNWTAGATAPANTSAFAIGTDAAQGKIYVTGGLDGTVSPTTLVNVYDTKTNSWTSLPSMKTARYAHEAAFIEGKLYVAGGSGIAGGLSNCEVYDPATQQWSNLAALNRPRGFAASTMYTDGAGNPFWFVVGGQDTATTTTIGTAELYDVRNNRWTVLADAFNLLTTRSYINGVMLGDYFYVVGGGTGTASQPVASAVNERIRLPLTPSSGGTSPVLAVPPTQFAIAGNELRFTVTANDVSSAIPLSLTATGVPAGASFATTIATNNSTRGTFRWTPTASDIGQSFTVAFRASDGGTQETRTVTIKVVTATNLAVVNAAHYRRDALSSDAIASAFGENLALRTESAPALPLPTELAGTQVLVNGVPASLLYVSPTQINFITPPNLDAGTATILVTNPKGTYAFGTSLINSSVPSLFTADASGRGDAAALATTDGVTYLPSPFALTVNGRPNILVLFGTGFRHATASNPNDENGVAETVRVTIDGVPANVQYAGAQGEYVGLDQLNIEMPSGLQPGARRVEVVVTLNGVEANRVTILLK